MPTNSKAQETPDAPKCLTNWQAFIDGGIIPTQIKCDGYYPVHRTNEGCHTNLPLDADVMLQHLDKEHGGGFYMVFRKSDGSKPWPGWKRFQELGIEIVDFRCAICDNQIQLDPRFIMQHMVPHRNGNRRVEAGTKFWMTISRETQSHDYVDAA